MICTVDLLAVSIALAVSNRILCAVLVIIIIHKIRSIKRCLTLNATLLTPTRFANVDCIWLHFVLYENL